MSFDMESILSMQVANRQEDKEEEEKDDTPSREL